MRRHLLAGMFAAPAICMVLCMFSGAARADVADIRDSDNALELDVGASSLDYAESLSGSGTTLDTEKGWMPSFEAGVSMLSEDDEPIYLRDIYFHLDGRLDYGSTFYNGGLCSGGVCTPFTSTTNDRMFTLTGQIGRAFTLNENFMLTPLIDLGYHIWDRQLTGTGSYQETYENGEFMAGGMLQFSPSGHSPWVVSLLAEGGTTWAPEMAINNADFVNTQTQAIVGSPQYNLQAEGLWEIQAKVGYTFATDLEATASIAYKNYSYGQSQEVFGTVEPNSTTQQTTALVGIAWHFDHAWYKDEDLKGNPYDTEMPDLY